MVASSYDLMLTLHYIQNFFPITVFTRSGCTNKILDYLNSNIVRVVNFAKIREAIAELNLRHFNRRKLIHNAALEQGLVVGDPLNESEVYADKLTPSLVVIILSASFCGISKQKEKHTRMK